MNTAHFRSCSIEVVKHRVATITEIPLGMLKRVVVEGMPICLVHAPDGNVYAIGDVCTHEENSLSEGALWGTSEAPQCRPAPRAVR